MIITERQAVISKHNLFLLWLTLSLSICHLVEAKNKKPDWVVNYGQATEFPADRYLTGFGSAAGIDQQSQQVAQDNARADLSRQVVVKISNSISNQQQETETDLVQQFSSVTHSTSSLQVMGLKSEVYLDDHRKHPTAYALTYIRRTDLVGLYQREKERVQKEIGQLIRLAESNLEQKELALQYYFQTLPLFEKLTESRTVLLSVGASSLLDRQEQDDVLPSKNEIWDRIQQLALFEIKHLEDVAGAIQFQFNQQFQAPKAGLLVIPFYYQDTKLCSQFARYLKQTLESKLSQSVPPTGQFQARSVSFSRDLAAASGADYIITGSYWEETERLRVLAQCRELKSGTVVASTSVEFASDLLPAAMQLKPENFQSAMAQQMAFAQQIIDSDQFQLEVWTDRGQDALLYGQGELMKIYLRSNRPCYVRLIYILADGQKTLLLDNLPINAESVNRSLSVNELKDLDFECAAPFGAEMLVAVGRTDQFDPLKTVEKDGYYFLPVNQPEEVAYLSRDVRGFKRRQRDDASIQQTESKLMITTVPFSF
jgi:hypothetical protein